MFFDRYPLAAATQLRREMGDLFDNVLHGWPFENQTAPRGYPALNIWEDAECIHAEAEVPGMGMEDLEVFVVGNELTIKGRRKAAEGKELSYHRQERGVGEFARRLTLPVDVNADKVHATLKDGILTLTLPKAEMARPKKIVVKAD